MCNHSWQKINDVCVCLKCGISKTFDGKVLFDRPLPGAIKKRGKKKRK